MAILLVVGITVTTFTPAEAATMPPPPDYVTRGIDYARAIAAAPGGSVWFSLDNRRSPINRIRPDGGIDYAYAGLLRTPSLMEAASDGAVWAVEDRAPGINQSVITRYDGTTGDVILHYQYGWDAVNTVVTIGDSPEDMVADTDGSIWYMGKHDGLDAITHIDPSKQIEDQADIYTSGMWSRPTSSPWPHFAALTITPAGDIWFTENTSDGSGPQARLGRLLSDGTTTTVADLSPFADGQHRINITSDHDGNIWATGTTSLVKVTPTGTVTSYPVPQAGRPRYIATAPDGTIWFSSPQTWTVGHITPGSGIVIERDPGLREPQRVLATDDGRVWFTNAKGGVTSRGTDGSYTTFDENNVMISDEMVTWSDGNVWSTNGSRDMITKMTPSGGFTHFSGPDITAPHGLTIGPDEALWFTNRGSGSIGRITASGNTTSFPTPGCARPDDITLGGDGNLWFVCPTDRLIGRITAQGAVTFFEDPANWYYAGGLTLGSDGNVWYTRQPYQSATYGQIVRVTPSGAITTYPLDVPGIPLGLAGAGDGNLYVSYSQAGTTYAQLTRFDPLDGSKTNFYIDQASYLPLQIRYRMVHKITTGPDGDLWATFNSTNGYQMAGLIRIMTSNPGFQASPYAYQYFIDGHSPQGITSGPDGEVWYSDTGEVRSVPVLGSTTEPGPSMGAFTTPMDGAVRVTWLPPHSDGGAVITSYNVTASPGGATCSTSGARSCVIGGLSNGTQYTFSVTATNSVGTGTAVSTTAVQPHTVASVPSAPTAVVGTPLGNAVKVSWRVSPTDPDLGVTGYEVTATPGGAGCTTTASSCVVSGLTPGTPYTFTVRSINAVGSSPASSASAPVIPRTSSNLPDQITARGLDKALEIHWLAPAVTDPDTPIIAQQATIQPGGRTCAAAVPVPGAFDPSSTCTIKGLSNTQPYTVTIDVVTPLGVATSAPAGPFYAAGPPSAPTSASANVSSGQIGLSWNAPSSDGGAPILGYSATAQPGGATCTTDGALSCTITGLTNGVTYDVTIVARNIAGNGAPNIFTGLTPQGPIIAGVPSKPLNVTATPGDRAVTVAWSVPTSNGGSAITGYEVTSIPGSKTCTTTGALSCTVTGLTNGTAYQFIVKARNAKGYSPSSDITAAVTPVGDGTDPDPVLTGAFHPMAPVRIIDSRPSSRVGPYSTPWGAGSTRDISVAGVAGVPGDATGVVLNVTGVNPSASTYLTIWPKGSARPTASNLNLPPGDVRPNLVMTKLGTDGKVSLYNYLGNTDVVVDVVGWYGPGGDASYFNELSPARIWDTRTGPGTTGKLGQGQTKNLKVTGVGGVPGDATAVVMNVTAVNPSASTYLTAWPKGSASPTASNLNVPPGEVRPNLVVAKVGANGEISFYNHAGAVDVVVDVVGYFAPTGSQFNGMTPKRVWDSRPAPDNVGPLGKLGQGQSKSIAVAGVNDVPADAKAVVVNITGVSPTLSTYITAWPTGETQPTASNLNLTPTTVIPNLAVVKVGSNGKISFYNYLGTTDIVVDIVGWYS